MSGRVLTLVQARTGSSRLPGKVLRPLGNGTVLSTMLERLALARSIGTLVVATTEEPSDDAVVREAERVGVAVFRGHETDLLDRHYRAWEQFPADAVVKIPSDCPLIDPRVVDEVIGAYLEREGSVDFVSNLHPQSWPDGNDVEVIDAPALERAQNEAKAPHEREHTTPYFWDNPSLFRLHNVTWAAGLDLSKSYRWTLDYPEDYELISRVYEELEPKDPGFSVEAIVDLLDRRPDLRAINQRWLGDGWYQRAASELKTWPKNPKGERVP